MALREFENSYEVADVSEAGFTLLELLISLTLLSLLLPIVFGGVHFGARSWERVDEARRQSDVFLVQDFLRRRIEQTYPAYSTEGSSAHQVLFSGASGSLLFYSTAFYASSSAGYSRYGLSLKEGDHGLSLIMSWLPELRAAGGKPKSMSERALLDGIGSFKVSYFGSERASTPAVWQEAWSAKSALPELVRIDVEFERGDRRYWPTLIVATKVTIDATCHYDPVSKACQGRRL